jgi:hypothetical protein
MITRDDKISALKREVALRKSVFPRRIKMDLMTPEKADHEIAVMEAILHDYIGAESSLTVQDKRVTSQ